MCAAVTEMILYKSINSEHDGYIASKQRLLFCLSEIESVNDHNDFCELQAFVNNYLLFIPKIDKIINEINFTLKWNNNTTPAVTDVATTSTTTKPEHQFLTKKHENTIHDSNSHYQGIKYIKIDEDTMVKACDIIKMITQEELTALLTEEDPNYWSNKDNTPNRNSNAKGINARFTNVSTVPYLKYTMCTRQDEDNSTCFNSNSKRDNMLVSLLKKYCNISNSPYTQSTQRKTKDNCDNISEQNRK